MYEIKSWNTLFQQEPEQTSILNKSSNKTRRTEQVALVKHKSKAYPIGKLINADPSIKHINGSLETMENKNYIHS